MPPKKTATVKKTVVASNNLSRAARASPAPRKKTGRDEGVKAPDMSDTSSEHSVCPICENVIVDAGETSAGEDAIYCEGRCKKWIHRCCAGLAKHEFLELKDEDTAYSCLRCTARAQGETIEELRGAVQALAAQLEELRVTVSSQQSTTCLNDSPSWSEIVRKKKTHGHKPSKGGNEGRSEHSSHNGKNKQDDVSKSSKNRGKRGAYSHRHSTYNQEQRNGQPQSQSRSQPQESCQRKPLPGKRKVWGTMKICPSTTVKSVISQLTCITDTSIQVKRKYKMAEGGKVAKWWHVVSGDEGIMAKLEEEWGKVQIQTSWVIKPCLSYIDVNPGTISINPVNDELPVMPITPSPSPSSFSTQPQVTDEGNAQEAASSTPTTNVAEDFDVNSANEVPSSNSPFLGEH